MTDISKISNGTNTYNIKDTEARTGLSNKQDTLVSGTNIKTINSTSVLGSGNFTLADQSLSNLDSTGQMIVDSANGTISNCVLEIPQNIKLTLENNVLTLKAGSIITLTGSTYATVTTTGDYSTTVPSYLVNKRCYVFPNTSGNLSGGFVGFISVKSGNTLPETGSVFFNTSDNLLYTKASGEWLVWNRAYPVCVIDVDSEGNLSFAKDSNGNNMIFNGMGFVGHHAFVYPGVKGLMANGVSIDGKLLNSLYNNSEVKIIELTSGQKNLEAFNNNIIVVRYNIGEVETVDDLPTDISSYYYTCYVKSKNAVYYKNKQNAWTSQIGHYLTLANYDYNGVGTTVNDFTICQPVRLATDRDIDKKQDVLVSGTNIKTINNQSILGEGNISTSTPIDNVTITENSSNQIQATCILNKKNNTVLPIWEGSESEWEHYQSTTWYYWKTNEIALWSSGGTLPNTNSHAHIVYGAGKFVLLDENYTSVGYYSEDNGETWVSVSLPVEFMCWDLIYTGTKFIAVSNGRAVIYSDDGITWSVSTDKSDSTTLLCYENGITLTVHQNNKKVYYSENDGINWIQLSNLTSSTFWYYMACGNGVVIMTSDKSTTALRSTDMGASWSEITLPVAAGPIVYIDNRFVAVSSNYGSNKAAYSTDGGLTWVTSNNTVSLKPGWISGGNGIIFIGSNTNVTYYSTDYGMTWTQSIISNSAKIRKVAYGNNVFVGGSYNLNESYIFSISFKSCYTLDSSPSVESNTYSTPEVAYQYNIESVSSGSIVLSDNNTYYYNSNGNTTTYRNLGYIEPTWLCNIKNVGIKIGNDIIAEKNKPLDSFITFPSLTAGQPLTLGASGTMYIAPKNGYYSLSATFSTDGILYMYRGSGARYGTSLQYSANQWVDSYLPMKQGEILIIQYNGTPTVQQFTFIYAE